MDREYDENLKLRRRKRDLAFAEGVRVRKELYVGVHDAFGRCSYHLVAGVLPPSWAPSIYSRCSALAHPTGVISLTPSLVSLPSGTFLFSFFHPATTSSLRWLRRALARVLIAWLSYSHPRTGIRPGAYTIATARIARNVRCAAGELPPHRMSRGNLNLLRPPARKVYLSSSWSSSPSSSSRSRCSTAAPS